MMHNYEYNMPSDADTLLSPRALYQQVAERLREKIFARELEPGAWIDELKLAHEWGISRTPLREALKVLAMSAPGGLEKLIALAGAPTDEHIFGAAPGELDHDALREAAAELDVTFV